MKSSANSAAQTSSATPSTNSNRCCMRREIIRFMSTPLHFSTRDQHKMSGSTVKLPAMFQFAGTGVAVLIALLLASCICSAQTQGGTVVAWGRNDFGQANYPLDLTDAASVST